MLKLNLLKMSLDYIKKMQCYSSENNLIVNFANVKHRRCNCENDFKYRNN